MGLLRSTFGALTDLWNSIRQLGIVTVYNHLAHPHPTRDDFTAC
jgi:hypothetical protein